MRIDVITEGQWIKWFWASKIVETGHDQIEFRLLREPDNDNPPDVNLWVDWNVFLHFTKSKCLDVLYVTHIHENSPELHSRDMNLSFGRFFEADLYLHQSLRTISQFSDIGFDPEKSFHLRCGLDERFKPRITLLLNGNNHPGKGSKFLSKLLRHYDFEHYRLLFCGKEFEEPVAICQERGIDHEWIQLTQEQYRDCHTRFLYERADAVLCVSSFEGGPMSLIEAEATGTPIISTICGVSPEISNARLFEVGDLINCEGHLDAFRIEKLRHYKKPTTWVNFNVELFALLSHL
jgi:hypothetical protein